MTRANTMDEFFEGNGSNLPANPDLMADLLAEDLDGFQATPVKIGIEHRSRCFMTADGHVERALTGIILLSQKTRVRFNETDSTIECLSADYKIGIASDGTEISCATCLHNQWGSGGNGKAKACKEQRKLLFLPEGWEIPAVIFLPPTSLRRFDRFASALVAQRKPLPSVVVTMRLEEARTDGGAVFAKLAIEVARETTPEEFQNAVALRQAFRRTLEDAVVEASVAEEANGVADLTEVQF